MVRKTHTIVSDHLRHYADRGVFRGFDESRASGGNRVFTFTWLTNRPVKLSFDVANARLTFNRLLPNIPARSGMYADLKRFVLDRHDGELPDHRRIDSRRAEARCSNRNGNVSISLQVKNRQLAYGVNRVVNLVHELFLHLHDAYPEYLSENFDVPQE